jgi:hypothetical protein
MRKAIIALVAATIGTLGLFGLAATGAFAVADQCPDTPTPIATGGASGSFTQDGVTITWGGTTVTITGGDVTFCVKGGTSGNSGIVTLGPGTYSTDELGLIGPQGQAQEISHILIYGVETPPPPPPPTTTTTTTTTTTPPTTTTTTPPATTTTTTTSPPPTTTTTQPPSPPGNGGQPPHNGPNRPTPKQLAFTGLSTGQTLGLGAAAVALLILGALAYMRGRALGSR